MEGSYVLCAGGATTATGGWSWYLKAGIGFASLVLVGILILAGRRSYIPSKLPEVREGFAERHGGLDYERFIPEPPSQGRDAAPLFRQAHAIFLDVQGNHGDWSLYRAVVDGPVAFPEPQPTPSALEQLIAERVALQSDAYVLLEQARDLEAGRMLHYRYPEHVLPELAVYKKLSREIAARAVIEGRAGRMAEACAWLESGLHLASLLNVEPSMTVAYLRMAFVQMSLQATETVQNLSDQPLPLSERYWTLLHEVSAPAPFVHSVASDTALNLTMDIEIPARLEGAFEWKLLDVCRQTESLLTMERSEDRSDRITRLAAASPPWHELRGDPVTIYNHREGIAARFVRAYDRLAVQCDFVRLAEALRNYKRDQGAYPDSLDALAPLLHGPIPLDPFTGRALRYRKAGEGFVLSSAGPDGEHHSGSQPVQESDDITWALVR